ncbi:phosphatase PAP2 family protein [Sphingomonas sp. JC676]|uniref:phosphatase PAP2 family protein n=1 Tax=Sphingomonas sp. JC676 TaxID=2768065 RepID=UPI00165782E8|nr:phosphatase PAP2 family protein [Sphingomonas sp. JC676]MBC9034109.1 phosphatase PAP2 family protein [Sphingomonas sp. JC676]
MEQPPAPTDPLVSLVPESAASRRVPWGIVLAAGFATVFAILLWLGHELNEGDGAAFDRAVMLAMRVPGHPDVPFGPAWLPSAVRDVTALGSSTVLGFVVLATALFLWLRGRGRTALLVLASTSLGAVAVTIVKALVGRSRPDLIDRLMQESSNSFPSGHAASSAIVYLTLATLLFPVVREPRMRAFVIGVALVLVGAIGISRVYLGVHWPSDVIAGWAFGSFWALLWWRIELRLMRRA